MSQKRSALGRGLGALISTPPRNSEETAPATRTTPAAGLPTATPDGVNTEVRNAESAPAPSGPQHLDVAAIDPNPEQPRREFDPEALEQLSRSITRHGVLQPIVVRRAGDRYELVMGERRFRATQLAGLRSIPAVVQDVDPADRLELAIVENVQREDLNPIELAHAYQALAHAGFTQEEIGQRVAKDRSSIANHIRLLDLSPAIQADVEGGRLSLGHAKALLQISDPDGREKLRTRILSESLSVRATERAARELEGGGARARRVPPEKSAPPALDPDTRAFVDRIERRLQTKVSLHPAAGGGGRIEIRYHDLEDLERLGDLLIGEAGDPSMASGVRGA